VNNSSLTPSGPFSVVTNDSTWGPLEERLKSLGFDWESFLNEQPPNLNSYGELLRLKESVQGSLQGILQHRAKYIRFNQIKSRFEKLNNAVGISGEEVIPRKSPTLWPGQSKTGMHRCIKLPLSAW